MLSGRKVKFARFLCLLAASLAVSAPAAGQCSYSVEIVYGPPAGGEPSALRTEGMNEMGDFTGWWRYALDVDFAFRYTQEEGVVTLLFPGFSWSPHAEDISNLGVIAGRQIDVDGYERGFVWDNGLVTELLPPGPNLHCAAFAINDAGIVVGSTNTATVSHRPAIWEGGRISVLEISEHSGFARDVNTDGKVVGYFGHTPPVAFTRRAFTWHDGALTILPPIPGGVTSSASAISERGYVAGTGSQWDADYDQYHSRALMSVHGIMHNLGTLPQTRRSFGLDINDFKQVVGYCAGTPTSNNPRTPFFYQNGVMHDLHELIDPVTGVEVEIAIAEAIDNTGVIIARGDADGETATFILTPRHVDGDLNFDCTVNVLDLLEMLGQWGDGKDMPADFNADGTVNVHDLIYLLTHWGPG